VFEDRWVDGWICGELGFRGFKSSAYLLDDKGMGGNREESLLNSLPYCETMW